MTDYLPPRYLPPVYRVQDKSDLIYFMMGLVLGCFFFVPLLLSATIITDLIFYGAGTVMLFFLGVRVASIFRFNRELKRLTKEGLDAERRR